MLAELIVESTVEHFSEFAASHVRVCIQHFEAFHTGHIFFNLSKAFDYIIVLTSFDSTRDAVCPC